jgi:hypothetical protein
MNEEVYKGYRKDELEYQFNPRVSVPEFPQLAKQRAEESRKVRALLKSWLNVPYGRPPKRLDPFSSISMAATGGAAPKTTTVASFRSSLIAA